MSFSIDAPNLQIWDNAAFDDALDDPTTAKSWLPLQPISTNLSHFRNLNPRQEKSSKKPTKQNINSISNDDVDAEIEEIENEIHRLFLKLEDLHKRRAEIDLRVSTVRRGRIIPAKFMEQKQSPVPKKMEESPARFRRRGLSLGPSEIHGSAVKSCLQKLEGIKEEKTTPKPRVFVTKPDEARQRPEAYGFKKDSSKSCGRQRGLSLGPTEIASGARSNFSLQEIKKKEKMQSLTVSPKSRKPSIFTLSELRKGVATVGAKKSLQKEDSIIGIIKPKNLFETQNPVSSKKPLKNAKVRIVASRYSLATALNEETSNKRRKWSLPEPDKRSLSLGETSNESEMQDENRDPLLIANSPPSILKIGTMLPKIRTFRSMVESPRDSGCAKRVAQLVGKNTHFSMEDGQYSVDFPCKFLKFEEPKKLLR